MNFGECCIKKIISYHVQTSKYINVVINKLFIPSASSSGFEIGRNRTNSGDSVSAFNAAEMSVMFLSKSRQNESHAIYILNNGIVYKMSI